MFSFYLILPCLALHCFALRTLNKNESVETIWQVAEGIDYQKAGPVFMKFGSQGTKSGEFKQPCAVATDKEGNIYIADFVNCRVQKFDKLGKFTHEFGSKGTKDGLFLNPSGLAVDSNGIVAVSDWDNNRVQLFSPEGKFIGKFGSKGTFL